MSDEQLSEEQLISYDELINALQIFSWSLMEGSKI